MSHSTHTLNGQANDVWATYYKWLGLSTGTPTSSSAGTELVGGSYARQATTAGTSSSGANTATISPINVPASNTPANAVGFDASSAGNYAGWSSFTPIPFSTAGTLQLTPTANQS